MRDYFIEAGEIDTDTIRARSGIDELHEATCDIARPCLDESARYACIEMRSLKQQPRHDFAIVNLERDTVLIVDPALTLGHVQCAGRDAILIQYGLL